MKILFGICGLGNGHCVRQYPLVRRCLSAGHTVALFTNAGSQIFYTKYLPGVPQFHVWIPMLVPSNADGLNFGEIAKNTFNLQPRATEINCSAMAEAEKLFGGPPDLVITDYEPTAAQFAYAREVPLVTIDSHGVFLGYKTPILNGFGPKEERSRLNLFFPKAEARIVMASIVPTCELDSRFPVEMVPPVLRSGIQGVLPSRARSLTPEHLTIVCYFSPYEQTRQSRAEIVEVFANFPNHKFIVFANDAEDANRVSNTRFPDRFLA